MKISRRNFLDLSAGAGVLAVLPRAAAADGYPSRTVRIIVGLPPGLTPDIAARLGAQLLSQRLGQQFVVDNRPGANGAIATEDVVRATPDGYTLLLAVAGSAIDAALHRNANFDFVRDIAPIAIIGRTPFVMVVNPSVPAKTIPEFIASAKANPGKLNYASPGIGGANHIFAELFKMMTGVDMLHVPYRNSFLPDLLSGQVQVLFVAVPTVLEHIRTGQLRALAVTTKTRVPVLPDVPAMAEFVPGYEASGWVGLAAPSKTPTDVIAKLNAAINAAAAEPDAKARLAGLGIEPESMTPDDFAKLIAADVDKWAKVIAYAGIKPE